MIAQLCQSVQEVALDMENALKGSVIALNPGIQRIVLLEFAPRIALASIMELVIFGLVSVPAQRNGRGLTAALRFV